MRKKKIRGDDLVEIIPVLRDYSLYILAKTLEKNIVLSFIFSSLPVSPGEKNDLRRRHHGIFYFY